jgi:formylglycine-generating enzyme required for sulfatase activity
MKTQRLFRTLLFFIFLVSCTPLTATPESNASPEAATSTAPAVTPTPAIAAGTHRQSEIDGMVQLYIPAGKFPMGTQTDGDWIGEDEFPLHEVYLDAFWMDQTEITIEEYQKCISSGECTPPHSTESETKKSYFDNPEFADYPVIQVDWEQAGVYCRWAGRRLPTEAEWEKAARGDTSRIYPWDGDEVGPYFANFDMDDNWPNADTSQAGSIPAGASPYQVMDMAGNVYEWVVDWYDSAYYSKSPTENPSGPAEGSARVIRGGAWSSDGLFIRAASRLAYYPDGFSNDIGFRCAQSN